MLIPSHLLASFSAKELEWIISGERGLNISAVQKRTKYMAGYSRASEVIQWFWEVLQTYSEVRHLTLCSVVYAHLQYSCFSLQRVGPLGVTCEGGVGVHSYIL